jgi:hypothetical protein
MSKYRSAWKARCRYCGHLSIKEVDVDTRGLVGIVDHGCPYCAQPGPWDLVEPAKPGCMSADIHPENHPSAEPAGGSAPAQTGAARLVSRLTGRKKPGPRS